MFFGMSWLKQLDLLSKGTMGWRFFYTRCILVETDAKSWHLGESMDDRLCRPLGCIVFSGNLFMRQWLLVMDLSAFSFSPLRNSR